MLPATCGPISGSSFLVCGMIEHFIRVRDHLRLVVQPLHLRDASPRVRRRRVQSVKPPGRSKATSMPVSSFRLEASRAQPLAERMVQAA